MYVSIPGYGKGKLNSAYAFGYNNAQGTDQQRDGAGAQLLIQTISRLSGLQIDHFAEVNLLGFINLSNIVGGVTVNVCKPTYDSMTGAHFAGRCADAQRQPGAAVRAGAPRLPRSDLDRVIRQQVYIAGMLRNVLSSHLLLNLSKQKAIVQQVGSSVTLDRGLNVFDLAAQMQSVQPGNITFQTVPGLTDAPRCEVGRHPATAVAEHAHRVLRLADRAEAGRDDDRAALRRRRRRSRPARVGVGAERLRGLRCGGKAADGAEGGRLQRRQRRQRDGDRRPRPSATTPATRRRPRRWPRRYPGRRRPPTPA